MCAHQVWTRRQLLQRVLAELIGDGERGGATEGGDDCAVERFAELVGDFALDETVFSGCDGRHALNPEILRLNVRGVQCREACQQDRDDETSSGVRH